MPRTGVASLPLSEAGRSRAALRRLIIMLAWPVAAEMSLQTVTQVVDMAMVGRLGSEAVAAIGLSFRPLFFVMSVFLGIGAGTTALVARFVGAGDRELANRTTHQALLFSAVVAAVLTGLLGIFSRQVITFMGAAPDIIPVGAAYVRITSPGLLFAFTAMVATSALRGAGDTQTSMKVNAGVNALNIFLNYVLIFGNLGFPEMGVRGAALGTTIARGMGGVVILALLCSGRLIIRIPWRGVLKWNFDLIVRLLRVAFPAMMERILFSSAMIFHLKMIATQGTTAVAAATLAQNIEEISFMPSIGLSVAAGAMVGQMLGARDPETAERAGWESSLMGVTFMGSMGVLFLAFPHILLRIYGAQGELMTLGTSLIRVVGVFQIPMAIAFVTSGALRGAGDTGSVMLVTAISTWGIRLGLTALFLFGLGLGPVAAYAAMGGDWLVRSLILTHRFRKGSWKEREV